MGTISRYSTCRGRTRKIGFDSIHNISHTGAARTTKLVADKFVWPGLRKYCRFWTKLCIPCQRAKTQRHNRAPLGSFPLPNNRFEHINMDLVGPLPPCKGFRYCLTIVDRYSRWLEAYPIEDITTKTIAFTFYTNWVARFGVPYKVTTDQGRQFESDFFRELTRLLGIKHLRTTAYHPISNGLIERWHRSLKAAIKCYMTEKWVEVLPLILLGFRSSWNAELKSTPAEMVYGDTLRIPGQFFAEENKQNTNECEFVSNLRERMRALRPTKTSNHSVRSPFIEKNLYSTPAVFVRNDAVRQPLQPPYEGPFPVIDRNEKFFKVKIRGKNVNVSIDRLKAAFTAEEHSTEHSTNGEKPVYHTK